MMGAEPIILRLFCKAQRENILSWVLYGWIDENMLLVKPNNSKLYIEVILIYSV